MRRQNTTAVAMLLSIFLLCALGFVLIRCDDRPIEVTPTLAISETPSLTPIPATSTPTITPSATATAEPTATPLPSLTAGAAISATPTKRATATPPLPTATFAPTAPPESHAVKVNEHLWGISTFYCGTPDWLWIYLANTDQIRDANLIRPGQVLVIDWPCPNDT